MSGVLHLLAELVRQVFEWRILDADLTRDQPPLMRAFARGLPPSVDATPQQWVADRGGRGPDRRHPPGRGAGHRPAPEVPEELRPPSWLVALLDVVRVNAEITPFVVQSAFLSLGDTGSVPPLPTVAPALWWTSLEGGGPLSA